MQQTSHIAGKLAGTLAGKLPATANRVRNKALVTGISGSLLALSALTCMQPAQAADWSDTSIGYRYGTRFAEPFNNSDITKNIVNLSHVSGYKYGKNFFNVDFLMSSDADPSSAGAASGAHEAYVVYRHTLDLGK